MQQRLWYSFSRSYDSYTCKLQNFKILASLCSCTGLEVIKVFSCSTQLMSTKFQLLIKNKIPTNEEVYCLKPLRCCIYHANKLLAF